MEIWIVDQNIVETLHVEDPVLRVQRLYNILK